MYREWMEKGPRMQIFSVELLFQFFFFFFYHGRRYFLCPNTLKKQDFNSGMLLTLLKTLKRVNIIHVPEQTTHLFLKKQIAKLML